MSLISIESLYLSFLLNKFQTVSAFPACAVSGQNNVWEYFGWESKKGGVWFEQER